MYLVLCRKIHAVTDHHKGTAITAYGYDQENYVTFGGNVGQYPPYRYGGGTSKKEKYAIQPEGAESKAMIILITGASHTGKTLLAQKLLEKYHYPYLSIDHLKMGLIRSGQTDLTPYDDDKLTDYLWSIIKEMIKTAIENKQNLIVEGCYIPFNWKDSFDEEYLSQIKYICLVMSESYIDDHFSDILGNKNAIEKRVPDEDFTIQFVKQENEYYLKNCCQFGLDYILIDKSYEIEEYCQL